MKITHLCYSFFVHQADTLKDATLTDAIRWGMLQRRAQERRASQAFSLFRSHSIEPILIKGLAAAWYYPESHPRLSVDMDLAVSAEDYEKAGIVAGSAGSDGLAIDLHRELRHLDTLDWDDLFSNSRLVETDDGNIRVLRPEDHLRVLCVHWLTDGGSNKDRLWDIYYIVANRPSDFDWDRFLHTTVGERRQRWLTCTVGLAQRYLGLDLTDTPLADAADVLPDWLIAAVEREWSSDTPAKPLEACLNDPKMLFKQVRKRLRPNQVWATVSMEGSFDAKTRFFYQIGNFAKRIAPSYQRVSIALRMRFK